MSCGECVNCASRKSARGRAEDLIEDFLNDSQGRSKGASFEMKALDALSRLAVADEIARLADAQTVIAKALTGLQGDFKELGGDLKNIEQNL